MVKFKACAGSDFSTVSISFANELTKSKLKVSLLQIHKCSLLDCYWFFLTNFEN